MFYGRDPKEGKYMTRAHLADMIALLGPPPVELLKAGKRSTEFFNQEGKGSLIRITPLADIIRWVDS